MPDSVEYLARIRALTQDGDFLALQREAPSVLAEWIRDVAASDLTRRPSPDKWSVGEILAHMAEDEVVSHWRYRQMLEFDGVQLTSFDQDLWAKVGNYGSRDPRESLEFFRLTREANWRMLERLSPEELQRGGTHAERGRITVEALARHMAGHDANHIAQIRRILGK
jgi:uncharacterized damage-inducible protein DinB